MSIATEIVTFKILSKNNKQEFIRIVSELEQQFHSNQPGFMDSELLYDSKTDQWIIIQHWSSLENMREASRKMFNNPQTEQYVGSLDPKSVKMIMSPQLGAWVNQHK